MRVAKNVQCRARLHGLEFFFSIVQGLPWPSTAPGAKLIMSLCMIFVASSRLIFFSLIQTPFEEISLIQRGASMSSRERDVISQCVPDIVLPLSRPPSEHFAVLWKGQGIVKKRLVGDARP